MKYLASLLGIRLDGPRLSLDTKLAGERTLLRIGDPVDWKTWRALREASYDFLSPWEPEWPSNGLSYSFFSGMLRRHWQDWRQDKSYAFLIFTKGQTGAHTLVGGIGLNDIQRSIAQKATLGYWIGKPYAGQGIMTEAARMVCEFGFGPLKLHRIEASCLPANEPSKKLLKHLGFAEEGYAKDYLRINGAWEDHILWGKTAR